MWYQRGNRCCSKMKLHYWKLVKTRMNKKQTVLTNFLCLQMILSHLLPALDQLLEKVSKEPETMLKDEAVFLHLILGKFNEHSATLLCKNQQSLDLFIKSLHAAKKIYEEIPPFQITALGQVWFSKRFLICFCAYSKQQCVELCMKGVHSFCLSFHYNFSRSPQNL